MSSSHVSTNFAWSEVACHSGAVVPVELEPNARRWALTVGEPLHARWGGAIIAVSWYRTPAYNAAIGGAPHSQHCLATAVDCRPAEIDELPRFKALIETMLGTGELPELGGIGWYPGRWVHLDIGPKHANGRSPRRWVGAGVGSEVTT